MNRPLPTALLATTLLLASAVPGTAAAKPAAQVVVQDAYIELRTGPGRGFPVFHVAERGDAVHLLRRRTDWIKVRDVDGKEGWVNRSQLERTLTPEGAPDGASMVSVQAAWTMTPSLLARADASQLLGSYSDGWLVTAGIAHVFGPEWRVSPFVGIGGGVLRIEPKTTLVRAEDRTDETAYLGAGLRGYLTNRFLLQAEYRSYVVFTDRDDNEEIDQWTVAFTYFF